MSTHHRKYGEAHFSSHCSNAVVTSLFSGSPSISGGLWKSIPMPMMERSEIYSHTGNIPPYGLIRDVLAEEENGSLCHLALATDITERRKEANLRPIIVLINVLFPEPLGPKRMCVSPG